MEGETKYVIYARKSTDTEEKQIQSIESQLIELRTFSERLKLNVSEALIERKSAKSPGRPVFDEMIKLIEEGKVSGIIAWHPDRLARNAVDGGRLIYMLDTGILKDLKFPCWSFENTPQGKLNLNGAFGYSKYYVDALAENVKRGLREKIRKGEFPGRAPLGYSNDRRARRIVIDPKQAPIVEDVFQKYATGSATLDDIRNLLAERGIRSRNGKMVGVHYASRLLSNPIYYGHFKFWGEVYEGHHEPIISKALFDRVQSIFERRWRYSPSEQRNQTKPYLGLMRCKECGYSITAECQKGHVYYRCTKRKTGYRCQQKFLREEALDSQISALLSPYSLRHDWAEKMLEKLSHEETENKTKANLIANAKKTEVDSINKRLQKLLGAYLDELIDREIYSKEKAELLSRKKSLEEQIAKILRNPNALLEPLRNWILEAKNIAQIAKTGPPTQRKEMASKIFGSNLVMGGQKVKGEAVKPWSALAVNTFNSRWVDILEAARTHFLGENEDSGQRGG